jgi:hypothetical protein
MVGRLIENAVCTGTCTFTYEPTLTPNITGPVSNSTIQWYAGDNVQITGEGFDPNPANMVIYLNT